MFSFSSALWLAAASAVITAEVSAAYNPDSTCELYGSQLKCARQVCCEGEFCRLSCDAGQAMHIFRADFGRKDTTTCSAGQEPLRLRNTHCSSPGATSHVSEKCNEKNRCNVWASRSNFEDPCPFTFKYLEVYYLCGPLNVVCEEKEANVRCGDGEVINLLSAKYSHGKDPRCSGSPSPSTSCGAPESTKKVAEMCNDKNKCLVSADNAAFKDPCDDVPKTMSLSYMCLKASV